MKTITIAITAVIDNDNILMINRKKFPFIGEWAMPGGKIEFGETIHEAAIREVKEETGIDIKLEGIKGVAREVIEKDGEKYQFVLFIFKAIALNKNIKISEEGEVKWIPVTSLESEKIACSDLEMIKDFLLNDKEFNAYDILTVHDNEKYIVKNYRGLL